MLRGAEHMSEKNTEQQNEQKNDSIHIPWIDRFETLTKQSENSSSDPDIDFITRIHELEGR